MAALHRYLTDSAQQAPRATAVVEPGVGSMDYGDLDRLSDQMRERLIATGVTRGDRVGLFLPKSIDALVAIFGALKAGAAYVPVDPGAPAARGAYILGDCAVKVVVVAAAHAEKLGAELAELGAMPQLIVIDDVGRAGAGIRAVLVDNPAPLGNVASADNDLAYILYTSGSTGKPKGVMLSHQNATSFVEWCSETFGPSADDRFSSHAPFHFDLSIFDIYLCIKHGATLVLIREEAGKDAQHLAQLIADERISIWYSAPSILALLAQFGSVADKDCSALRQVHFAGEVFAVKHLRALTELWPRPRYFNLYGPTETNVCTWYEVPLPIPPDRTRPFPIGTTCSHVRSRVVDEHGGDAKRGSDGELCIAGSGVMQGYWALPERTAASFWRDAAGIPWYRTGDMVNDDGSGCYTYLGRRDRMVKRRGYRVELGEIEAGLYRHPGVREAAVIAHSDDEGVTIIAFVSSRDTKRISLIEMKRFCAEHLPLYMIPDRFVWVDALPKTSTDKIDYQRLKVAG
jgi:amino acid adenylation domain-containing protein